MAFILEPPVRQRILDIGNGMSDEMIDVEQTRCFYITSILSTREIVIALRRVRIVYPMGPLV